MAVNLVYDSAGVIAAPGVDTDILAADLQGESAVMYIGITCAAGSIVKIEDDGDEETLLNAGGAVTAGQNLTEKFLMSAGRTYNIQLGTTDGAINSLVIYFLTGQDM